MEDILKQIYQEYPKLSQYPFEIIDSRGKTSPYGGVIEFYSPNEKYNPRPGKPTVEIFDKNLKGEALKKAIFGDMLHYLPEVDPQFAKSRSDLVKSLTPEQLAIDKKAYDTAVQKYGEKRPFTDWFAINRQDAYLRGYLAPDANDEWKDAYTPNQIEVLKNLQQYLKTPAPQEKIVSPMYQDPFGDTTK